MVGDTQTDLTACARDKDVASIECNLIAAADVGRQVRVLVLEGWPRSSSGSNQLEQVPPELTVTAADSVLGKDGLMESTVALS